MPRGFRLSSLTGMLTMTRLGSGLMMGDHTRRRRAEGGSGSTRVRPIPGPTSPPRTARPGRGRGWYRWGLGRVGKRIRGAAPPRLNHGDSTRDDRRAGGGGGAVVPSTEGPRAAADGYTRDGRGHRLAVPHRCAVARHPGAVRELEFDLSAVLRLVRRRHLGAAAGHGPGRSGGE